MSTKQTFSLSKRFVFAVLGLAFMLVVLSSLLTFSASRKLERTLEELTENQRLTAELESLPLRLESLLNEARAYTRSGTPEELAKLKDGLAARRLWDHPAKGLPQAALGHPLLAEIELLSQSVDERLDAMVVEGEAGRRADAAAIWVQIEHDMPGQKLQALTTRLTAVVREDFQRQARLGAEVAASHQRTGLGIVGLAIILGVVAAVLLGRRLQELETFITVCAWTKRVKYEGRWVPFEEFLEKRFRLKLSHGISEEAARLEMENLPKPASDE